MVTVDATTAVTASPILLPILPTILNTAPAKPCISGGEIVVIRRLATVNNTSAQIGAQAEAKNAQVQKDHSGLMMAMRSGDTEVITAEPSTRTSARSILTSHPVRMFVA